MKKQIEASTFWVIGAVSFVVVAGLLFFVIRKTDPAAQPPKPVAKFNMAAHADDMIKADMNYHPAGRKLTPDEIAKALK